MPKVMLVEDDNNLREIYDARLVAEGYEIVSAHDGEEALALAIKEKPDLIITDVMMPKISGFDMLDILRDTPETKNTKVIMMTALSQAEDRERADKLGADRYLIKSQVTLEDVIKVAHEVLNDTGASAPVIASVTDTPAPVVTAPAAPTPPADANPAPAPVATVDPTPVVEPPAPVAEPVDEPAPVAAPPAEPATPAEPAADTTTVTAAPNVTDDPGPSVEDVIEPTTEEAPAEPVTPVDATPVQTETEEADTVEKQITDFIATQPSTPTPAPTEASTSTETTTPSETAPETTPEAEPPTETTEPPSGAPVVIEPTVVTPEETTADPTKPASTESDTDKLSNPVPDNATSIAEAPSHKKLVLQPTDTELTKPVDLNALLEKENQKEASTGSVVNPNDISL